ncbi:MAG TPA: hypothetical protein VLH84_01825 [Patescibacteria group bacterium]|nr:hypothetical protein [Patescibacteria group bacterium]
MSVATGSSVEVAACADLAAADGGPIGGVVSSETFVRKLSTGELAPGTSNIAGYGARCVRCLGRLQLTASNQAPLLPAQCLYTDPTLTTIPSQRPATD